jgi:hypothetical protein
VSSPSRRRCGHTDHLSAIRDAARATRRGVHRFDDFILYLDPRKRELLTMMARGLAHKARTAVWPQ